jgi:hypothetical protein
MRKLAKGCLLALVLLTWVCWKLDGLSTPQVVCVQPDTMEIDGVSYPCVLPLAALDESGAGAAVYVVESTESYFTPLVAQRFPVTVQARTDRWAAVSGLASGQDQVVLYASRALTEEDVSVSLWSAAEEPGRVEVLCELGQNALAQAFSDAKQEEPALAALEETWEDERLVLTSADRFTAQYLETALENQGLPSEALTILDYAWYPAVLAQGWRLCRLAAATAAVWLFLRLAVIQIRRERQALGEDYFSNYLWENSVRLLALTVAAAAGGLACLALLRWLWRVALTLPTGFLPEGSIFDGAHYRQWWAAAFPAGYLSYFGIQLATDLKRAYLFSAAVSVLLLAAPRFSLLTLDWLRITIKRVRSY